MTAAALVGLLAAGLARAPVVPSAPKPATEVLPLWRTILQLRRNALSTWGEPAYELEIFSRPFLGRTSFLVNHPDGDPAGAGRQPRQLRPHPGHVRILQPIIGEGLFLAEGAAWRHQRRTMAPAFAPRSLDVAAAAHRRVADETVAELARARHRGRRPPAGGAAPGAGGRRPLVLLPGDARARRRPCAPPSSATAAASPGPPSSISCCRPRRRARSTPRAGGSPATSRRVLDRMIAERARTPPADPPRDLFDVLVTARDPETGAGFTPTSCATRSPPWPLPATRPRPSPCSGPLPPGLAPEVQEQVADEAAGVDLSPEPPRHAGPPAADPGRGAGGAAPLPAGVHHRPHGAGRDELPARGARRQPGRHGTLDLAPAPQALGASGALRPDPLPARRPAADRFAYLPFGIGPRVCIGAQFALIEATLVLARLAGGSGSSWSARSGLPRWRW